MTVSGEDLVAATSILLLVCVIAALSLAVMCRLLLRHQRDVARERVSSGANDVDGARDRGQESTTEATQYRRCTNDVGLQPPPPVERSYCVSNESNDRHTSDVCPVESDDFLAADNMEVPPCAVDENVTTSGGITCVTRSSSIDEVEMQPMLSNSEPPAGWLAMQQSTVGSKIQRALSCDSVISDTSVSESDNVDDFTSKVGQLEFSLQYRSASSELIVTVIQARDLECDHVTGSLDSYVCVTLNYRSATTKRQTKVIRNSMCPHYLETFAFNIESAAFDSNSSSSPTLQFLVYSSDKYARHRLLGETDLHLADIELHNDVAVRLWLNLHELDQKPIERGSVMVSLNYLPTAERLILVVVKAQNLCWPSSKPVGDCCVKVYMLHNGKRIAKKKTSYKHEESSPTFNEAMIFTLPQGRTIENIQLKISVIVVVPGDCRATCIGHVTLGPHSTGTALIHWTQTMTSMRKPVTMWHNLS